LQGWRDAKPSSSLSQPAQSAAAMIPRRLIQSWQITYAFTHIVMASWHHNRLPNSFLSFVHKVQLFRGFAIKKQLYSAQVEQRVVAL
jgi:hypothetical protein